MGSLAAGWHGIAQLPAGPRLGALAFVAMVVLAGAWLALRRGDDAGAI